MRRSLTAAARKKPHSAQCILSFRGISRPTGRCPGSGENIEMSEVLSGAEFKKQLRAGQLKLGLFLNSHSPTLAEQLAHSGYDWLLVDTQHGPMGYERLSAMLCAIGSGGAKSMVRVAGYHDRGGIQQALDLGSDGVLVPYINTAEEARQAVSCCRYPTAGTRSVYFPQRSTNKAGLLGTRTGGRIAAATHCL